MELKIIYDMDASSDLEIVSEINEAQGGDKKYKIRGTFTTIGDVNRNGRTYPSKIWESEVSKYQEEISSGSINTLMEYHHPPRTEVEPMEAVAKITKLEIVGNRVIGEAVLLNNTKANQLKTLIDNGIKISVSSRGVGNVKNGIVENFKLITYDVVPTPSDYNATMNGVVESYQLNEGIVSDLSFGINEHGNIVQTISKETKQNINKHIMDKFATLLGSF